METYGDITQRIPYTAGHDHCIEMNLTRNAYRHVSNSTGPEESTPKDEPLGELIDRVARDFIHPLDKRRFEIFWDLDTMRHRLKSSGGTLHSEFVTHTSRSKWTLTHCTVVSSMSNDDGDEVIICMTTAIRSPQLAQIALNANAHLQRQLGKTDARNVLNSLVEPEDSFILPDLAQAASGTPRAGDTAELFWHGENGTKGQCPPLSLRAELEGALEGNEFDQAAINAIPNPMVLYELDRENINIIRYNESFSRIIGAEELLRRKDRIQRFIHKQDLPAVYQMFRNAYERPFETQRVRCWFNTESGESALFSITVNFTSEENGVQRFFGLPMPIEGDSSESIFPPDFVLVNRSLLNELTANGSISDALIENAIGAIAVYRLVEDKVVLKGANSVLLSMFHETEASLSSIDDRNVLSQMFSEDIPSFMNMLNRAVASRDAGVGGLFRFVRRADSKIIWCRMNTYLFRELDNGFEFITSVVDDSERQESIHMLETLSHRDELTGLYNRRALMELQRSLSKRSNFAFLLADIDDFKIVNDTFGHAVGDEIIRRVASVVESTFRSCDYVCRIGGDELAVVITDCTSEHHHALERKVNAINEALLHPHDGLPPISISVGISFSSTGKSFDSLYHSADIALYRSKRTGKGKCSIAEQPSSVFDNLEVR